MFRDKHLLEMDDKRKEIYDAFEEKLRSELIKLCTEFGMMDKVLLRSDDIDGKWDEFARSYMIDAVHEFNEYPEVTLAWAGYLGMAVARHWDINWIEYKHFGYEDYYGARGYDDMDEHITRDILGYALDSAEAIRINGALSRCAALTLTLIRHEGFESQSIEAYYALIRCVKVMYQIGAAMELYRLGYKYEFI